MDFDGRRCIGSREFDEKKNYSCFAFAYRQKGVRYGFRWSALYNLHIKASLQSEFTKRVHKASLRVFDILYKTQVNSVVRAHRRRSRREH